MSKFPFLFQTGSMGRMQLRNRIIMAPLGTNLADASGAVTRQLIDWYAERAWGEAGLVIVENSMADIRFGRGAGPSTAHRRPQAYPRSERAGRGSSGLGGQDCDPD